MIATVVPAHVRPLVSHAARWCIGWCVDQCVAVATGAGVLEMRVVGDATVLEAARRHEQEHSLDPHAASISSNEIAASSETTRGAAGATPLPGWLAVV
jgi:hypothetical protein